MIQERSKLMLTFRRKNPEICQPNLIKRVIQNFVLSYRKIS